MDLGMIGLGRMGANLVRRLLRDGHRAVVYDVDPASVAALVSHRRMTLTFPAFERVGSIPWIVAGADKTSMLERLLAADPTIPAGRVPQERAVLITDGVLGS